MREEPRPDRLPQIKQALQIQQARGGAISVDFTCRAAERIAWLIAEIERLREYERKWMDHLTTEARR
jgi:uncharacterized small protein (DUF1192 family)